MTETQTATWSRRQKRGRRKSPRRPGPTIRQFAEAKNVTEPIIRGMVKRGQLDAVEVNGVMIITPRGDAYWRATFGESN